MSERGQWPIIVGGCPRSGTSLVRRILDSHPRFHCGPEITFFRDFYGDYRDDPLAHLRFTRTARALVSEEEALHVLGRAFVELHERAARRAGKARWADKAPENVLYTDQWERLLEERWLFLHVVRNPLDTVASMRGRFPLTLPRGVEAQAALYRTYAQAGLTFEQAHPERSMRVVYEALCEAPRESIERLMNWAGEGFEPGQFAFNELPHEAGLEDPKIASTAGVHPESVGRWRSELSADEAALVWARTGDLWETIDPTRRFSAHVMGD